MTQILNRWNGNVIISGEIPLRELVITKVAEKTDLCGANLCGADLCGADLRGANLCGADLCGADLRGADLRGANLCDADLRGADLRGANLRGANLCDADLCDADLRGADYGNVKIKHTAVFSGIYKYIAMPIIADDGTEHIRMGCFFRTTSEWESDFWNNKREFPNTGDMASNLRWLAYQTCLEWLKLNR